MDRMRGKWAIVIIITILFPMGICMRSTLFTPTVAWADEIGPDEVQGKVVTIQTNVFRRGTIVVKSDQTGKTYTFYVGRRTIYVPHRYPGVQETIKVTYINDRGFLKATRVEIVQGT